MSEKLLKSKLLLHKRKVYLTYGIIVDTMFGDLDRPLNASHGFVGIS